MKIDKLYKFVIGNAMLKLYFFGMFLYFSNAVFSQKTEPNYITKIEKELYYTENYPFIKYEENILQWENKNALKNFYESFNQSSKKPTRILHIGDSHLQADFYTGYVRSRIQHAFGEGGRGMIFPYAAAKTHAAYDYKTTAWGDWGYYKNIMNAPSLPIGISGATIFTQDTNAGFSIQFYNSSNSVCNDCRKLTFMVNNADSSFDIGYNVDCSETIWIDKKSITKEGEFTVTLPCIFSSITVKLKAQDSTQSFFECYGLKIENTNNNGVLYSSVGINGAGLYSLLRQMYFPEQLAQYNPDLVILDIGANDYYTSGMNKEEFMNNLEEIIKVIKKSSPKTSILLSCSQDIQKRRKYSITATAAHAEIIKETAIKMNCGWYNFYKVSGGFKSMAKWKSNKLSKADGVHLNAKGYNVKGELFYNALLKGYLNYYNVFVDKVIAKDTIDEHLIDEDKPIVTEKPKDIKKHVVKKGESLYAISKMYDVSVENIMAWNTLNSSSIRPGMVLIISGEIKATNTIKSTVTDNSKKIYYTVKPGDTLSQIAEKYNTNISQLRKLNNLKNNKIFAGKKIRIK